MSDLFDRHYPAELGRIGEIRQALREGLEGEGIAALHLERLILVVDEVVSNSIEHGLGYRRSPSPIRVRVSREASCLVLTIDDADAPEELVDGLAKVFAKGSDATPSALMERGRGMFLITMFLEDLRVMFAEGGGMRLQGRLSEIR